MLYSTIFVSLRHRSMVLQVLTVKDQVNSEISQWETPRLAVEDNLPVVACKKEELMLVVFC